MSVLIVPPFDETPWPSLGGQVCDLIEERAIFGPGSLKGEPAKLDDEKRAAVWKAYEVHPPGHQFAGKRRFRRVRFSWRKGTAKTELMAWIAYAELHPEAPVRFDGWDADGNPVGRPVRDPYIPLLAFTQEQVEELAYGALMVVCQEGPDADLFDAGLERIIRLNEFGRADGKAVPLANSPNARDGARTTFQGFDETHRLDTPRIREAYRTMEANLPKRPLDDPWSLGITTAGVPGGGSVAELDKDEAEAIDRGEIDRPRLFYFHRQAGTHNLETGVEYDLANYPDRIAAISEASGPSVAAWSDLDGIAEQWDQPNADTRYLERTWLNRWTQADAQAFDARRWRDDLGNPAFILSRKEQVTLGLDGSRWKDTTALVLTHMESGWQKVAGLWRPEEYDDGNGIPPEEVDAVVDHTFDTYNVLRMYGDPAAGWDQRLATYASKHGHKRVAEFYTDSRNLRATAQMCRSYAAAIKAGEVTHDGSDDFARHIGNAQKRDIRMEDEDGQPLWVMTKERHDSENKIDLAMAGGLSWKARLDVMSAGLYRKRKSGGMTVMR